MGRSHRLRSCRLVDGLSASRPPFAISLRRFHHPRYFLSALQRAFPLQAVSRNPLHVPHLPSSLFFAKLPQYKKVSCRNNGVGAFSSPELLPACRRPGGQTCTI